MEFTTYTDGACSGNRKESNCPGGYGYIILDPGNNIILQGGSSCDNTTNNRMELLAVIKGMLHLKNILNHEYDGASKHDCIIKTDSRYVMDNFNDYLPIWKKNGWKKSKGSKVLNKDLWIELDKLTPEFRSLKMVWVKAHARNKWNNLVDSIAQGYTKRSKLQPQT